mmetsp:Transcript_64859/g.210250  ORF Transcript_64859/g.210250 Transcript_64859/m.210250 type:complete len:601 (-) Transcript_64859:399-2201(-)
MGGGCSLSCPKYSAVVQVAANAIRAVSPKTHEEEDEASDQDSDAHLPREARGRELASMMRQTAPKDHSFLSQERGGCCPPQAWLKRLEREWRILARGLPEDIHLHIYEDRMDLLRAVVIGPEGTPYADAMLFFDIHLPLTFPRGPPSVKFWSFNERVNPNLYANGMVCLSLLGTWTGSSAEVWRPQKSNLLQILVSLQGLVLVEEPYYNEPGFERTKGTPHGNANAQRYSEDARVKSLCSLLRIVESPPIGFEDITRSHFAVRATCMLRRLEQLVEPKQGRKQVRIDGIDMTATSPSEHFKRELNKLLASLRQLQQKVNAEFQPQAEPPLLQPRIPPPPQQQHQQQQQQQQEQKEQVQQQAQQVQQQPQHVLQTPLAPMQQVQLAAVQQVQQQQQKLLARREVAERVWSQAEHEPEPHLTVKNTFYDFEDSDAPKMSQVPRSSTWACSLAQFARTASAESMASLGGEGSTGGFEEHITVVPDTEPMSLVLGLGGLISPPCGTSSPLNAMPASIKRHQDTPPAGTLGLRRGGNKNASGNNLCTLDEAGEHDAEHHATASDLRNSSVHVKNTFIEVSDDDKSPMVGGLRLVHTASGRLSELS